jgi:ankyrin repeat protein
MDSQNRNLHGWKAIHLASANEGSSSLELLLKHGIKVEQRNPRNDWTPLHAATSKGLFEQVQLLLRYGAQVNSQSTNSNLFFLN